MSRWLAAMLAATAFCPAAVYAQDGDRTGAYGPQTGFEGDKDTELPLKEPQPCDTQPIEDGVIVVCRELTDQELYRDPLPAPIQSDRVIMSGLNDPPCWVTKDKSVCIRVGWAPEPAIMVDTTAFPEKLSDEDAALVVAVVPLLGPSDAASGLSSRRMPIDLSEDD